MVVVENLSKVYGQQRAVDNISFEAKPGKILGFLGPNGAGKSTTMKIITGFIPQTSGSVKVCGFDVETQSQEVRQRVGYLPEHNPLYLDMYVKEYLHFVAGLHKVSEPEKRVLEMIEKTGLQREQHKLIGQLSKGYRQRVGLAQAMLHNPEVLILDEPTSGLDPNQLSEIRKLIKELGKEKTVIFSTHIMQEVEAVSDHVVIINKGKIVANDSTVALKSNTSGKLIYRVVFDKEISKSALNDIPGVKVVEGSGKEWQVESSGTDAAEKLFDFAKKQQVSLLEITKSEAKLEEVFRLLTN